MKSEGTYAALEQWWDVRITGDAGLRQRFGIWQYPSIVIGSSGKIVIMGYEAKASAIAKINAYLPGARPRPQPVPVPIPVPPDSSEVLGRIDRLERLIASLESTISRMPIPQRGPPGPQGRPGRNGVDGRDGQSWDRAIVRQWVSEEVSEQISKVPVIAGRDGRQGPPGKEGPRGPPGQGYDPSEMRALESRIEKLEDRVTVVLPAAPKPRDITIRVVDPATGKEMAKTVTVKPNQTQVTLPINRPNMSHKTN